MKRLFVLLALVGLLLTGCAEQPVREERESSEQPSQTREQTQFVPGSSSHRETVTEEETPAVSQTKPSPKLSLGRYYSTDENAPLDCVIVESVEGNVVAFSAEFYDVGNIGYATAEFDGNTGSFVWSDEGGYQFAEGTIQILGNGKIRMEIINTNVTASESGVYEYEYFGTERKTVEMPEENLL
jgi:hypothetical protein